MPAGQAGNALITPNIALSMIENMIAGHPPFRPELGVGGASWFITEGTPYAGVGPSTSHTVPVQVDLIDTSGGRIYEQADLDRIFAEEKAKAQPLVEEQVRERFQKRAGRPAPPKLSKTLLSEVAYNLRKLAERRMWERIGREVGASTAKVAEVILPPNGPFSELPGRFKVVADANKIRLRGGVEALIATLRRSASPVPALEAEAATLARSMKIAGRIHAVLRVGGRILIVAAVSHDIYRIVIAEDKTEAIVTTVGGWAGAGAGAAAFSAFWAPADVVGPWAWVGHGVGALIAGGIGYWVGSETTRQVYKLIVHAQGDVPRR